jgi:UDP-N-acetylglucosamine pyrophosphorylase
MENVQRYLKSASDEEMRLYELLVSLGMERVFSKYLAEASHEALERFFCDLRNVDFKEVQTHRALLKEGIFEETKGLVPAEVRTLKNEDLGLLEGVGLESLRSGEWGVVVFAGGQSTRFYEGVVGNTPPKGLYPVYPVGGYSFLDAFVAHCLKVGLQVGTLPFLILLVSRVTRDAISKWVREGDVFGFPKEYIIVLPQGENPRLDEDGDIVAMPDGRIAFTGDGHGGVYKALLKPWDWDGSSLCDVLLRFGIKSLVMHNVDNLQARPLEPSRLGFHRHYLNLFSMSVCRRRGIYEKVGVVVLDRAQNRIKVIEYSMCPKELQEAVSENGEPLFAYGHINTNLVELSAVSADIKPTVYTGKPFKVGEKIVQTSTIEYLNQDLCRILPKERVGIVEVERGEFFWPTKNRRGESSLEETQELILETSRKRLARSGARVGEKAMVEIAPFVGDEDVATMGISEGFVIENGAKFGLGVPKTRFLGGFRLASGASFVMKALRPFGSVLVDMQSRACKAEGAPEVVIEDGVEVLADVDVVMEGGGKLVIRRGRVESRTKWVVRDGDMVIVP